MKTKLVLWAKDSEDARVLLALQLKPAENTVCTWQFTGETATEELHKQLMESWREGKDDFSFPEGATATEADLSAGGDLMPEGLTAEKQDILQRAQTEWLFIALSSKLHQSYANELSELKEKISGLSAYSQESWDELKHFWAKVREQMRDRNLFREHADELKTGTNELFDKMKELRSVLDAEFRVVAEENYNKLKGVLDDVEERIKSNTGLYNIFEELKAVQHDFRNAKLTKDLRSDIWDRIDRAFKEVKEKRFGKGGQVNRFQRRYDGLINAIKKMEQSIKRDEEELTFQERKINSVYAQQLETQIRQAKIKMIQERIRSKKEKLKEMYTTKVDLEDKIAASQREAEEKAAAQKEKAEAAAKAKKEREAAEKIKAAQAAQKAKEEADAKAKEAAVAAEQVVQETPEVAKTESIEEVPTTEESIEEKTGIEATKEEEKPSLEENTPTAEVEDNTKVQEDSEEKSE